MLPNPLGFGQERLEQQFHLLCVLSPPLLLWQLPQLLLAPHHVFSSYPGFSSSPQSSITGPDLTLASSLVSQSPSVPPSQAQLGLACFYKLTHPNCRQSQCCLDCTSFCAGNFTFCFESQCCLDCTSFCAGSPKIPHPPTPLVLDCVVQTCTKCQFLTPVFMWNNSESACRHNKNVCSDKRLK